MILAFTLYIACSLQQSAMQKHQDAMASVVENQLDLTRVSPPNKSVQGLNIRYYGSNYSVIADGHSLSAHEDSQNKKIFLNSVNCVIQS